MKPPHMDTKALSHPSFVQRVFAIVDTETTGTSPISDQIIEIAIIRVENGRIVREFRSLVRPSVHLPPIITSITGIGIEDLADAPSFDEIALEVRELLDGAVLVAHNARFDYSFIKNEFTRLGISWKAKTLCTVKLSRLLFPHERRHSLDEIIERHHIPCASRHRAYDDALALWRFMQAIESEAGYPEVATAMETLLLNPSLPTGLEPSVVRGLPRKPGVYRFYGEDGDLLYVGKSVDIRARVLSHFSSDHRSAKELRLCEKVVQIDYTETSGELSALLLESRLIKQESPPYNRALRKARTLALITERMTPEGFKSVDIGYHDEIPEDSGRVLAVFRTQRQAKEFMHEACREHALCLKVSGLEKIGAECFQAQLGNCKGACTGREEPAFYNARFDAAFAERRIRSWPFPGPVVVKEDPATLSGTAYVVDQWRIAGTIAYDEDGQLSLDENDALFDFDTYKILLHHLLKKEVFSSIVPYESAQAGLFEDAPEATVR